MKEIYLDNAATTPLEKETVDVLRHFFEDQYYNPSALYRPAIKLEKELEKARKVVAEGFGVPAETVTFTSGGTEGSNTIIKSVVEQSRNPKKRIITTAVEHPAVLEVFKDFEKKGVDTIYLPVLKDGSVDLKALEEALNEDTVLVSIMAVNNELGTINDLVQAGQLIRRLSPNAVFHSDFVQAYMKVKDDRIDLKKAGVDAANASAHKAHGPKGIGAMYIRKGLKIKPLLLGGGQEHGMRSGTENVPLAAGFSKAVELRLDKVREDQERAKRLKERFLDQISDIEEMKVVSPEDASPYVINLAFRGVKGEVILHMLEDKGIYVSTGSACSSHHAGGYIQRAIGLDPELAAGTLRISMSDQTTPEEIDVLAKELKQAVEGLRRITKFNRRR